MKIFSYWDSGRANAPEAVQRCLLRWEQLNPDHELVVHDASSIRSVLTGLAVDPASLPVQALSDILRIRLLRQHGGVWTDATVLPALPLSAWSDSYLSPAGFFVYMAAPRHWRLATYLILAEPGNRFIEALDDMVRAYWFRSRRLFAYPGWLQPQHPPGKRLILKAMVDSEKGPKFLSFYNQWRQDLLYPVSPEGMQSGFYPYFWLHYLMMKLTVDDPAAAEIVSRMPYRLHEFSHSIQNARRELGEDFRRAVETALLTAPIQKLDWRQEWPEEVFKLPEAHRILI